MRILAIAALYALSLALLWVGSTTAPQMGWPRTDVETTGCGLLLLGVLLKGLGHWQLLAGRRG